MKLTWKHFSSILVALAIACVSLWNYSESITPKDILSVSFLDIGQGDAIYIRAPNGNDVLIDGGPNDTVMERLKSVMPMFDRDIDLIVATHPDKDHIAGLVPVFAEYDVNKFLHSEVSSDSSFDEALQEAAANETDVEEIIARRGQRFIIDDKRGVFMDILFPDADTSGFKETNDASIITRLVYGTESFLLTGDAGISQEQFLARNDTSSLQSTVLKLGHHGSNTSTSDEFLDQVKPTFGVVSAGKNNSYKHPAPSVVTRVKSHGIKILSTIDSGTITFESDGRDTWIK